MEFSFNSLSPSDLGESLHFLGDSNCHFHPTVVTRNSSWVTPARASTPRFRTSLEHRFNSSCIIRLKRPSTPPALYISISTRTRVMDLDENRAPLPSWLLCSKEEENPIPGAQICRHPVNRWIYGELSSLSLPQEAILDGCARNGISGGRRRKGVGSGCRLLQPG